MHYVYILKCADDHYYTGCTENLEERIMRHSKRRTAGINAVNLFSVQRRFLIFLFFSSVIT
ncbi:MAG: GIY-YIG nuclease family protein [Flavisolibacter sp.]